MVHVDQTRRNGHDYERAESWMTAEANAAIAGAFEGGATAVLVNDSHGECATSRSTTGSPGRADLRLAQTTIDGAGAHRRSECALFVGYHAGAGSRAGILDHTMYGRVVARLRVGGSDWNETALNAAVCGSLGVPVALVTGDQTTCAQARQISATASRPCGQGRDHALRGAHAMPAVACERIRAARDAVRKPPRPFQPRRRSSSSSTS